MNRPAADQDTTTSNIDKVVEVALETFARQGFEDTRLETSPTIRACPSA